MIKTWLILSHVLLSTVFAVDFLSAGSLERRLGVTSLELKVKGDKTLVFLPEKGGSYPLVVFLQGANVKAEYYSEFATELANDGYVVVIQNNPNWLPPGLYATTTEITKVLDWAKEETLDSESPVYQKIDTDSLIISGHSYGSAAGWYGVSGQCVFPFCWFGYSRPKELKAAFFYGSYLKNPLTGKFFTVQTDGIPVAIIEGTLDHLEDAQETINSINGPAYLYEVDGANHYGICNVNNPPGALKVKEVPEVSQEKSISEISKYATKFLKQSLK